MDIHFAARLMAVIFGGCGMLSVAAAVMNWDWFFRSVNVRMLTFGLRRPYQRLIYGICGCMMILMCCRLWTETF